MNKKIIFLIFCMIFLVGNISAADYVFQNSSETNLTRIYGATGNMDVYGNVSASWFKGIFNWIVESASSLYLSFNGTSLSFNQTALNTTINSSIDLRSSILNVNSSNYWDGLDSPSDINASDITDDNTYLLATGDTATGNYTFDSGTLFIDSVSDRIGIGTSSPYADTKLTLSSAGGLKLTLARDGYTSFHQGISTTAGVGTLMGIYDSDLTRLAEFYYGGNVNFPNGNVGIGTTSPGTLLNMKSATGSNSMLRIDTTDLNDATSDAGIEFYEAGVLRGKLYNNGTDNSLRFNTLYVDNVLVLRDLGNVGIGTTAPKNKLDVEGGAVIGATYSGTNTAPTNGLLVQGNVGIGTTSPQNTLNVIGTGNFTTALYVNEKNVETAYDYATNGTYSTADEPLWTANSTLVPYLASANTFAENNIFSKNLTVDTNTFFVDSSTNNVGIGTTSPDVSLDIETTDAAGLRIYRNSGNSGLQIQNDNDIVYFGMNANDNLGFGFSADHSNDPFQLTPSGNIIINEPGLATDFRIETNNDANAFFVNGTSDRVGIGTTTPQQQLEVESSTHTRIGVQSTGTTVVSTFAVRNSTGSLLWEMGKIGNENNFRIYENGSSTNTRFMIANGGNVGIGTTSPAGKLDITLTSGENSDTAGTGTINLGISADDFWAFRQSATALSDLAFDRKYAGTWYESMRIQRSTGNVGIGTTSPGAKLEVVGSAIVGQNSGSNNIKIYSEYQSSGFTTNDGELVFKHGGYDRLKLVSDQISAGSNDFDFKIKAINATVNGYNDWVTVKGTTGNVGIGTTSPGAKLEVAGSSNGDHVIISGTQPTRGLKISTFAGGGASTDAGVTFNAQASSNAEFDFKLNGASKMVIDTTGYVGIGTTSPNSLLDVSANTNGNIRISSSDTALAAGEIIGKYEFYKADTSTGGAGVPVYIQARTRDLGGAFMMDFITGTMTTPVTSMTISDLGYVGIGTTNPQHELDVVGDANVTGALEIGGAWQDGGVSITGGSIYAQAAYFYNITGLNVSELNINGSLMPRIGFDNTFDIGSNALRWRDLYVGRNAYVNGSVYANTFYGDGSGLTNLDSSAIDDIWVNVSGDTMTGTLNINANLTVDTNTLFVDAESNMVGIGTATPASFLEVRGAGAVGRGQIRIGVSDSTYWEIGRDNAGKFVIADDGLGVALTIDDDNGKVGIGTTTPDNLLNVEDAAGSNTVGAGVFKISAASHSDHQFSFRLDNTEKDLHIDKVFGGVSATIMSFDRSSGRVGIGTTSPDSSLQVVGDGTLTLGEESTVSGYINSPEKLYFNIDSNNDETGTNFIFGTDRIAGTGGTELMRIEDTGNVGIGTTSPQELLHLKGGNLTIGRAGSDVESGEIIGSLGFYSDDVSTNASGNRGYIQLINDVALYWDGNPTREDTRMEFQVSQDRVLSTAMTLDSTGNVGIGTTSPSTGLHLNFSSSVAQIRLTNTGTGGRDWSMYSSYNSNTIGGGKLAFSDNTAGSTRMVIDSSGKVGIGTTSPSTLLQLNKTDNTVYDGTATAGSQVWNGTTISLNNPSTTVGSFSSIEFGQRSSNVAVSRIVNVLQGTDDADLTFVTEGGGSISEKMRITGTGNIGIGTSSPSYPLHVNGSSGFISAAFKSQYAAEGYIGNDANNFWFGQGTNGLGAAFSVSTTVDQATIRTNATTRLLINSAGNVGIGTSSPVYKLDINSSDEIILNINSTDNRAGIRIADDDTTSYIISEGSMTSLGQTNSLNAANLNIDSSGHLGVSSTTISGNIHIMQTDIDADIDNVFPTMIFGQQNGTYTAGTYYGNLRWARPNSNGGTAVAGIAARTLTSTTADLIFYTQQNADNVHLERMTIAGSGNVGIGTSSPGYLLHLNSTTPIIELTDSDTGVDSLISASSASGGFNIQVDQNDENAGSYFGLQIGGTNKIRVDNSGNVGINTTSPTNLLHVEDSSNNYFKYIGSGGMQLSRSASTYGPSLEFQEDGTLAYRIKLDNDGGNVQNLQFVDASAGYTMTLKQGGNVGIGTTTPTQTLNVVGEINVTDSNNDVSMYMEGGVLIIEG